MHIRPKARLLFILVLGLAILASGFLTLHFTAADAGPPSHPSPSSQSSNWSMVGYNAQHTGYSPNEHMLNRSNIAHLSLAWSYYIFGGIDNTPVVVDGIAYIGSYDNTLYALNAHTGALLWSFAANHSIYYTPVVADGFLYFSTQGGGFYALNAKTGRLKWMYSIKGSFELAPVVDNGIVYVGGENASIDAFDAKTGRIKWRYTQLGDDLYTPPSVANGIVYACSFDGVLHAINAKTGQREWIYDTKDGFYSTAAVTNGIVYISVSNKGLYAINARTGQLKWVFPVVGSMSYSPSVANNIVYFGMRVYPAGSGPNPSSFGPSALFALNAQTGQLKWSFATQSNIRSEPAIANNIVYFDSHDGNLYALDAKTGQSLWGTFVGEFATSPAVTKGMLYVVTQDNTMKAFQV